MAMVHQNVTLGSAVGVSVVAVVLAFALDSPAHTLALALFSEAVAQFFRAVFDLRLIVGLLLFFSIVFHYRYGRHAVLLGCTLLVIFALVVLLQVTVQRDRPVLQPQVFTPWGFPSLHAAMAFGVAYMLGKIRWAALWYGLAVIVALSRVYVFAHYFSDIIVGGILGLGVAYGVWKKWGV